jgi:hypothetical protein
MRNHYEHDQQVALFQWRAMSVYSDIELKWMHSNLTGAFFGSWATTNRIKAEGMKKGIWDIYIPWPVQKYCGCYVEMKSPGNKLTPDQAEFQRDNPRYYFIVAYDWVQAKDAIIQYLAGSRF